MLSVFALLDRPHLNWPMHGVYANIGKHVYWLPFYKTFLNKLTSENCCLWVYASLMMKRLSYNTICLRLWRSNIGLNWLNRHHISHCKQSFLRTHAAVPWFGQIRPSQHFPVFVNCTIVPPRGILKTYYYINDKFNSSYSQLNYTRPPNDSSLGLI